MGILSNILGFGLFGLGARAFQLGIMRKPLTHNANMFLVSGGIWGLFGYGIYKLEQSEAKLLHKRVNALSENRQRRGLHLYETSSN